MKKTVALAVLSAAALGGQNTNIAFAESSVKAYGVIDTLIRHANNEVDANGARGSVTKLEPGLFQGSRLGFKGIEDLGNYNTAVFQLEMGFRSDNGARDQQGQMFGRQAFVGLKNKDWGEIDFGRQYGVGFNVIGGFDPLGNGNITENSWQLFVVGIRFDNTLRYTNTWGPVTAEAQYSFGEQAGSASIGSTAGLGLTYDNGIFRTGIFNQRSTDANSNIANTAGIGASLDMNPVTFYVSYINGKRDPGFGTAMNNTSALANTSLMGNRIGGVANPLRRTDNIVTTGLVYHATPKVDYTLGYMTDFVNNETAAANSGRLSTLYAVMDYHLSPRTDVYIGLDHIRVSGGEIDNGNLTNTVLQFAGAGLGGATRRTGVSIGMRHTF